MEGHLVGRGKELGFFFPKCDRKHKFSLMDKETELQGSDVNLPKKEDLMRCSCCLSQTSISSFFTSCLSLVRFGKIREHEPRSWTTSRDLPVCLREARWSYESEV